MEQNNKSNKTKKKHVTIAIDKAINELLEQKSINKSKLINSLLEKSTEEEYKKFVK